MNILREIPIRLCRVDVVIVLSLVVLALRIIRRLFFHPLSSFPGPRLAAISSYYKTYYEVVKDGALLDQIDYMHAVYGPVVRVGPNELHFADYRAYFDIYSVGLHLTKDPKFYSCFGAGGSAFGAIDPYASKARRAFMHIFLSRRAVINLEPMIQQKIQRLITRLASAHEPTNIFLAFRSATLDIITTYMFGHCLDALEHPTFSEPLLLNIQKALPLLWITKSFPWLIPILYALPSWMGGKLREQFQAALSIRQFLLSWLDRTRHEVESYPLSKDFTICHYLFDSLSNGGEIFPSMQCIVDEALSILQAGSDTVGNTCTVGTFHIINNDAVYARLSKELRSNWPDKDQPIDLAALQNLPYLTAVIKEALRLSHGFVTPLPRVVGPSGAKIIEHNVPPNTIVSTGITYVHLNSTIFPNPTDFVPERWLEPSSHILNRYLVSFSTGPRMCLGYSMAWAELYLFFGHLFRKLDLKVINTNIDDFRSFKDFFVPVYEGKPLHIVGTECI